MDEVAPESQPLPRTKQELLDRIAPARARLDDLIGGMTAGELARDPGGGWSPTDHLAHIAVWERMIAAHLNDGSDHDVAQMDAARYAAISLDDLNAHLHVITRDRGVAATLAEFREAHRALIMHVEGMSDDAFVQLYWGDDLERRTVMEKIAGDTYLHYEEHRGWIAEIFA